MYGKIKEHLTAELGEINSAGLFKAERIIAGPQGTEVKLTTGEEPIIFCANNYLGLSSHPEVIQASKDALDTHGYGMSSVRFICGTQDIHKELEDKIANFMGTEDTILYAACFDANGGVFEPLLGAEDAIISDALNHASIIDGVRLCKAERFRYSNSNMEELEQLLIKTQKNRLRLITTDGVFSMDGYIAKLDKICSLAKKYKALVHVDDSHATGFVGKTGRGSAEHYKVMNQVDIITSTLGKALGGASGGFTSANKEIIDMLRQKSRPYLFSNSLAPVIVASSITVLDMLKNSSNLIKKLNENTSYFRKHIKAIGLSIKEGIHPIVPIMIGDAKIAQKMAEQLLEENIYVISFSFPVVPKNEARIRVQISAGHTKKDLKLAINAFEKVAKKLNLI